MRRPFGIVALIGAAALLAIGGSGALLPSASERDAVAVSPPSPTHAVAAATPPIIGCAARVEPSIDRFEPRRDVIRGSFALVTIKRDMPRLSRASYRPDAGRVPVMKLPVGLRARQQATLRVSAAQRRHAALIYRQTTRNAKRIRDADRAVTFKSCPAATPAFAGGTVGPITGWAGALIMSGPSCVRLELRVDGHRRPDIRLPLGRRCR